MRLDNSSGPSPVLVLAGIVFVMLVVLVCGYGEIVDIRRELAFERFDTKCREEDDPQACGQAALVLGRHAASFEEITEARDRFATLCAEHPAQMSCRIHATVHTPQIGTAVREDRAILDAHEMKRSFESCVDERDPRGCFVAVATDLEADRMARVVETAEELCEDGEKLACWALFGRNDVSDVGEVMKKVCAAGFERACEDAGIAEPDVIEWCRRGHPASCAEALESEDLSPRQRSVFEAIAGVRNWSQNPGFEDVTVNHAAGQVDLVTGCVLEDAAACFGAALGEVADETETWRPELPEPEDGFRPLFRVGCEHGFDAACKAYAVRLLDRPFGEKRNVELANEMLDTACQRGDAQACWMKSFEAEILEDDYSGLRAAAAAACSSSRRTEFVNGAGPCPTLRGILSADIGAAPWVRSDRVALDLYRPFCEELGGDGPTCARGAYLMSWSCHDPGMEAGPCLRSTAWEMATTGCFAGSAWACRLTSYIPATLRSRSPESVEEVVGRLCDRLPDMCAPVKEARGLQ